MYVRGAHILLTGGTRGIGRTLADELVARGARLTLVARNRVLLQQVAARVGGLAVPADLADPTQIASLIATAEDTNGPVDVLINNAGLMAAGPLEQVGAERLRDVVATNLVAPLELARQAIPSMLQRRSGLIVNITSLAGELALRNIIPYCATKSALTTATRALERELRGTGVHTQLVVLGYVQTEMMDESHDDPITGAQADRLGKLPALTPQSVATAIADGIERNRRIVVLPPLAGPVHHLRQIPQRIVDLVMTGLPQTH